MREHIVERFDREKRMQQTTVSHVELRHPYQAFSQIPDLGRQAPHEQHVGEQIHIANDRGAGHFEAGGEPCLIDGSALRVRKQAPESADQLAGAARTWGRRARGSCARSPVAISCCRRHSRPAGFRESHPAPTGHSRERRLLPTRARESASSRDRPRARRATRPPVAADQAMPIRAARSVGRRFNRGRSSIRCGALMGPPRRP